MGPIYDLKLFLKVEKKIVFEGWGHFFKKIFKMIKWGSLNGNNVDELMRKPFSPSTSKVNGRFC